MDVLSNNYKFSLIFFILFQTVLFFIYYSGTVLFFTDYIWSVFFVGYLVLVYFFRYACNINLATIFSLFYMTSILFIGGRLLAIFFGYSGVLFNIDFFGNRYLEVSEASHLMLYLFSGFVALEIGLYLSLLILKENKGQVVELKLNKLILYPFLTIFAAYVFYSIQDGILSVISGGYLALYDTQDSRYGFDFTSTIKTILAASIGVFLVQDDRKMCNVLLLIIGFYYFGQFIMGLRGGFICYLLLLFWYKSDFGLKKINVFKVLSLIIFVFVFLTAIFNMVSFRGEVDNENVSDKVLSLLYAQGVTLMVFNDSMSISNYPIVPYFQNFIPGVSFVFSTLGYGVNAYEVNFGQFLSYTLDPVLFGLGYGLGWSLFSDAHVYSFGNIVFYSVFIVLFSVFINYMQNNINKNIYLKVIISSLVIPLCFLPRAGLNTVFPLIFYTVIFLLLIMFLSQILRREH